MGRSGTTTIETEEEHTRALAELERLMDADPSADSTEGARLEALAAEIESYEEIHFRIPEPTPEEAAQFRADEEPRED
jgi:HTH-type transcriptional regulator/antitoxin HigA